MQNNTNISVDCLIDASSIIKYYHKQPGTNIITYLFEKSPTASVNLLNIQVPEVASIFYNLRFKNCIKTDDLRDRLINSFLNDIWEGKIKLYNFTNEYLKDIESSFNKIYSIFFSMNKWSHFKFLTTVIPRFISMPKTKDIILLMMMEKLQNMRSEAYLFTSNRNVVKVAMSLNLNVINPEEIEPDDLPLSLDRRNSKRFSGKLLELKATCKDSESLLEIGSAKVVDISHDGVCLKIKNSFSAGQVLNIKLSSLSNKKKVIDIQGEIVWHSNKAVGIKFTSPISLGKIF